MRAATNRRRLERPSRGITGAGRDVWRALGSTEVALVVLAALATGALAVLLGWAAPTWAIVLPLAAMVANLTAAIATRPVFRRNGPLLMFHVGLIVIAVLAALGRMTYLEGTVEIASGGAFVGELASSASGPWHIERLKKVQFVNDGFRIFYDEHGRRMRTQNAVRWRDEEGIEHQDVIGEHRALTLAGYRFVTTNNKGYAPEFVWIPRGAAPPLHGRVHLPSYPAHEHRQALAWRLGDLDLWTMLQTDDRMIVPGQPSEFRLPRRHMIVVRVGEDRYELAPAGRVRLPQGDLVYRGLGTWMGYTVRSDWTPPWLAAAGVFSALGIAIHFKRKFGAQSWLGDAEVRPIFEPARQDGSRGRQ